MAIFLFFSNLPHTVVTRVEGLSPGTQLQVGVEGGGGGLKNPTQQPAPRTEVDFSL